MLREATRTSLELLYHVSRELAAALDLQTVLQQILYLSIQNVGAISGSIVVLDDTGSPVDSAFSLSGRRYDPSRLELRLTFERGLSGWVARNRQAALVPDTSQDERWYHRPDDEQSQTGAKSAVCVPILVREHLAGVMTLIHPKPHFFTSDHLDLVRAIADQAGIAILNGRLYAESRRQARVMTAVAESAAVINASLDLDEVLQLILEQVTQALRVEGATLALIDPQTHELVFKASTGEKSASLVGMRLALGQGVAGWVAEQGIGVIVPDAYHDSRFFSQVDHQIDFTTRALACAPIRLNEGVIGVLEVINPLNGAFDPDALSVLTGIGNLAGAAIRHAQLFESQQAAHQRYRELFEDSIDPILITDWNGCILETNRRAEIAAGLRRDALRSLNIAHLHRLDREKVGQDFEFLASGLTISYESVLLARNGSEIPIQVYTRQVQIEGAVYVQWILRDITEHKNLDLLRDDLTSMIYHDLRSPLANVVSSLEVLGTLLPEESSPALKSLLNIAVRSTERIQRLTNSLLDINRLEAGQPVGNRHWTAPAFLVQEAVESATSLAANKNLHISSNVEENCSDLFVDADMIRRVLVNLVENAIKFTPPGGTIEVGLQAGESSVRFWVKDSGPGIPASECERVFEKFARLRVKDGPRGFGLGLAFCRLAVQAHGGRIWVDSEPDQGAAFQFTLPSGCED